MTGFAHRTWQRDDIRRVEIVAPHEFERLSDHELVTLIMLRSSLDEEAAREALSVLRGGPPDAVAFER